MTVKTAIFCEIKAAISIPKNVTGKMPVIFNGEEKISSFDVNKSSMYTKSKESKINKLKLNSSDSPTIFFENKNRDAIKLSAKKIMDPATWRKSIVSPPSAYIFSCVTASSVIAKPRFIIF